MKDKLMGAAIKLAMCPGTLGASELCGSCPCRSNLQNCVQELKDRCYVLLSQIDPEAVIVDEDRLKQRVSDLLFRMGATTRAWGYQYLVSAIVDAVKHPDKGLVVTKAVYPEIAQRYSTSPAAVEIAIRRFIERLWSKSPLYTLEMIFEGLTENSDERPTNSEFITRVADWVRRGKDLTE